VGSVAWRVNLLSALCAAGAAVLLFGALVLLTGDVAAGLLAAGVFAFAPLVWPYAITAEVFALNNLFAAGLVYWSARALREDARGGTPLRTLHLGVFWLALRLSNHHTLVFFGLPFGLLVLALAGRRLLRPRVAGGLAPAFTLGALPYLYLPLSAARPAPVTWGDASTWAGFLTHFFRREYGTFRLADESIGSAGALWPRFVLFWQAVARSTPFAVIPLGLAAVAAVRRPGPARRFTGLWLAALLFSASSAPWPTSGSTIPCTCSCRSASGSRVSSWWRRCWGWGWPSSPAPGRGPGRGSAGRSRSRCRRRWRRSTWPR